MRLIFQHIERTGGTALCRIAHDWCERQEIPFLDYPEHHVQPGLDIPDPCFIAGHNLSADYRHLQGQWITLLRDPIDRTISEWEYIRNKPEHHLHHMAKRCNWREFSIKHRADNIMVRRILGQLAGPLARDAWSKAEQVLRARYRWSAPPADGLIADLFGAFDSALWRQPRRHYPRSWELRGVLRHIEQDLSLWRALE